MRGFEIFGIISLVIGVLFPCIHSRAYQHKVHNLALFPDRHSWCQVQAIRQEISAHSPECQPKTIDNVVCLGACFSYSVPRSEDDAVVIPPYCDACRPTHSTWTTVVLNCTKEDTQERYVTVRNVELIGNCSCVDCNGTLANISKKQSTLGTPHNSKLESEEDLDDENILEDEDEDDEKIVGIDSGIIHKLRSVSAELKGLPKGTQDLMIQENKIIRDDDTTNNGLRGPIN